MMSNYEKQPLRNNWDKESILHHTYNDGYNPEFEIVDGSEGLIPLYGKALMELTKSLSLVGAVNISFKLSNVAINTNYMRKHDHNYPNTIFATTHYVKFDKNTHPNTTFVNPAFKTVQFPLNMLGKKTENSIYSEEWEIDVEEDDMLIFPAHLEHYVKAKENTSWSYPRLVVSANVDIR
jgi:hypothetical protein